MSNTRQIVDFAINDEGKELRDALYAEIHDRVMNHFDDMKLGIAKNIVNQEETVYEAHDDEAEDKKLVKKMVKKSCMKTEGIEDNEDSYDDEEDEEYEDEDEINLEDYSVEELLDFMTTEEYAELDEESKIVLNAYIKEALNG